jgi:DNA-binding NarL/FixJ family response regulator
MIPHILIVNKDQNAARVTAAIVGRVVPAAKLTVASGVDAARRSVPQQPPDILLIDLSPGHLEDDRLIRTVKAFNPRALVIALTSLAPHAAARRFTERQIDGYVAKGSDPAALMEALRDAIQQQGGAEKRQHRLARGL